MRSTFELLSGVLADPRATSGNLASALESARTIEDEARAEADHLVGLRPTLVSIVALTDNANAITVARDRRTNAASLIAKFEARLADIRTISDGHVASPGSTVNAAARAPSATAGPAL